MTNFLTKSKAEELKLTTVAPKTLSFGEINPHSFSAWDEEQYKKGEISVLISYLGKFSLKQSDFKKAICPVCGKEEVIVYSCCASVLSGANVIRGYCTQCNEYIAFNDNDYYHLIKDYVLDNIKTLKPLRLLQNGQRCIVNSDGRVLEI